METEVAKCIISISDTANIVMAIASVLNLIIVVWIFMKERKEEERKNIKNKKHDWYKELEKITGVDGEDDCLNELIREER